MVTEYRRMLAELPHDPLNPPGGRRRAIRKLSSQRGSAEFVLLTGGAMAGAVALALFSPSEALRLAGLLIADNARTELSEQLTLELGGSPTPLRLVPAGDERECVPGARFNPTPTRAGYASAA
jgi:hypothetical protein